MKYKEQIDKLNEMNVPTWINYIRTTESEITFLEIVIEVIEYEKEMLEFIEEALNSSLTGEITTIEHQGG